MTYQDLYLQHLEGVLNRGGKEEVIDAAIKEFNEPTSESFKLWIVQVPRVLCTTCGDFFQPENPELDQEMLCKQHAKPTSNP